jgi:2-dehydro-3-deoxygluconokinase
MLRLTTPRHERFNQARALEMTFGGAEANVAASLAILGDESAYVTRLPKNAIADACIQELRGLGVDTRGVLRGGDRIGVYYLEAGAAQRPTTVTYDRAGSALATLDPVEIDWGIIFKNVDWFHFTGITPALSPGAAHATLDAVKAARDMGLTVSCDLNYRRKLWSRAQARATMSVLLPMVDYCIANEEDADDVFGVRAEGAEVEQGRIDHARYVEVAVTLTKMFNLKGAAITLRESFSASRNGWSALYYTGDQAWFSRRYEIDVVDRVGAGDAFAAGFIHASGLKRTPQEIVDYAAAASCLKHSIFGDYNRSGPDEVEALLSGDGSGRVQR